MIIDNLVSFVPLGAPLSLVAGAATSIPSNVYDLLGLGVGVSPGTQSGGSGGQIWGNTTVFGQADAMGVGNQRPELNVTIGTALAGAVGLTLNCALQCAVDQGAAGNYQPGTWINIGGQDGITLAQGAANTVIFRSPWLPPFPANERPRFLRLLFSPVSSGGAVPSGAFTAGTISSALVVMSRDDYFVKYQPKNYSVA
jgi:hypothetical protein